MGFRHGATGTTDIDGVITLTGIIKCVSRVEVQKR